MSVISTPNGPYYLAPYVNEADLESSILAVKDVLFGRGRIYLDVKRKIGTKGGQQNIPDGYLIDLSSATPRLYVVENELAAHDHFRHIAVQILQFSLTFHDEPHLVKQILFDCLQARPDAKGQCESYALRYPKFRNLDHLLETLVFETDFAALVIMDELPDRLEILFAKRFNFGVESLELRRYRNEHGEFIYRFEPFLADLQEEINPGTEAITELQPKAEPSEVDTVVVPARDEGFQRVFRGENRWYAVRIHGSMRPQIKYIAAHRVAPESAITHMAAVKSIEPWADTGKFVLNFSEPAAEIKRVPMLAVGRVKTFQNLRYTSRDQILSASSLDDIW